MSWKLTVKKIYHGIPKTYFIKSLSRIERGLVKCKFDVFANFVRSSMWIYVAHKRYENSILAHDLAGGGAVVVTDRFPLHDFHKMPEPMDGPRLTKNSGLWGACEAHYYDKISVPDRIFVLQVALDELRERKSDLPFETHKIKADAVNSVIIREGIVLVDANKKYSEVLLEIKKLIWDAI